MKEKVGEVFSIAKDDPPVPGCTISKAVHSGTNDIIFLSTYSAVRSEYNAVYSRFLKKGENRNRQSGAGSKLYLLLYKLYPNKY